MLVLYVAYMERQPGGTTHTYIQSPWFQAPLLLPPSFGGNQQQSRDPLDVRPTRAHAANLAPSATANAHVGVQLDAEVAGRLHHLRDRLARAQAQCAVRQRRAIGVRSGNDQRAALRRAEPHARFWKPVFIHAAAYFADTRVADARRATRQGCSGKIFCSLNPKSMRGPPPV